MERKNHVTISEFDLKEAIRQTIFSVADTSSKKAMTGELWEINGKELKIVALDGHRISLRKIKLKKEYEPRKVIVQEKHWQKSSRLLAEIRRRKLQFTLQRTIFSLR